jgi:hypothetical protein
MYTLLFIVLSLHGKSNAMGEGREGLACANCALPPIPSTMDSQQLIAFLKCMSVTPGLIEKGMNAAELLDNSGSVHGWNA